MDPWPHLNRAPIVEGLIDIRIPDLSEESVRAIKTVADSLAAEFPAREDLRTFTGQFSFSAANGPSFTQSDSPAGFVLRSADGKWAAQFRANGFAVSRLEPYTSWGDLLTRTQRLWGEYARAVKPEKITRVATRFVNRIPLAIGQSFDSVFKTTFNISASLPQSVHSYLLRFVLPFEAEQAAAIVTQSTLGPAEHCIFDLDVFADSKKGVTEQEAWGKIEQLRGIKNRLFFESLTVAALKEFE